MPPLITEPLSKVLRLPAGRVDMNAFDAADTSGFPGAKQDAAAITEALAPELSDLQERMFAVGRTEESTSRRILVVLQGMDTSGKGGVIRHAIGMVDPQGVTIKAFKAPTEEERAHHYLWRIERELPPPGLIGIFDRSHYEDVLVVRVNNLVDESVWSQRYDEINAWEDDLVQHGTVMIKCFLNISSSEQKERLLARLEDPTKQWKYNPGDVDERAKWPIKPCWSAAIPSARRGTSSRPIASGIGIGPLPSCWSSSCAPSTCAGLWPTSTSTRRRLAWPPVECQVRS